MARLKSLDDLEAYVNEKREQVDRLERSKATGPRTPQGKAVSSRNATRHGLTAKAVVLPDEDQSEFDQLLADINADRKPVGELELQLTSEIAACIWRLTRARRHETWHFQANHSPFAGRVGKELDLILRYTGSIERQLTRTIGQLERLQAARIKAEQAQAAIIPAAAKPKVMVAGAANSLSLNEIAMPDQFVSSYGNCAALLPTTSIGTASCSANIEQNH